jgi:large subunit ribosomal protein L1
MTRHGKRYRAAVAKIEPRAYELDEALTLLRSLERAKFDETVEVAMNLNLDTRQSDQQVRGSIALPKGTGRSVRVAVFAQGEQAEAAAEAGASVVGADDLVARVQDGWLEFDVAIATPEMMPKVSRLGRILGPKGLMPSPKSGTVAPDVARAVGEFKAGRIEYRTDDAGNVHVPVGKMSFTDADLKANIEAFVEHIRAARPPSVKGQFIRSVTVTSTMGPGMRVSVGA